VAKWKVASTQRLNLWGLVCLWRNDNFFYISVSYCYPTGPRHVFHAFLYAAPGFLCVALYYSSRRIDCSNLQVIRDHIHFRRHHGRMHGGMQFFFHLPSSPAWWCLDEKVKKKNSNLPSQICCWNNGWKTYCDYKSTQPIQLTSSDWCSTFEVMTLRHVESMSEFNGCANHVSIFEVACVLHGFYRNMVLDHGWFFGGQTTTQGFYTYFCVLNPDQSRNSGSISTFPVGYCFK